MAQATLNSAVQIGGMAAHAALNASVNGSAIDALGYSQALLLVKLGTTSGTSGTFNVRLQESDASGGPFTDVSGSVSSTITLDAGAVSNRTIAIQRLVLGKRYIRYSITMAGGSPVAGDTSVCLLLTGAVSTTGAGATESISA